MPNILDYLTWRGDVPFSVSPPNEVDNYIHCKIGTLDFTGIVPENELYVPLPQAVEAYFAAGGAEKLLGKGDMLFMPVGASKPVRVQGTLVEDEEITAVLNYIKKDNSAQYNEEMIAQMEKCAAQEKNSDSGDGDGEGGGHDPMLKNAVEVVIDAGQASTSLLQRRCKLGYARAARIMDEMEQMHIIGPYEGAKPRQVLISRTQWLEMCARAENPVPEEI